MVPMDLALSYSESFSNVWVIVYYEKFDLIWLMQKNQICNILVTLISITCEMKGSLNYECIFNIIPEKI